MPVIKYRSVEEMSRPPRVTDATALAEAIRRVWRRAATLAPPPVVPRGVTRFRTIEEANEARQELMIERMKRSR